MKNNSKVFQLFKIKNYLNSYVIFKSEVSGSV